MDDDAPEAEAKMRQVLGLSDQAKPPSTDDSQRLARQAIRSQAAGREYAERQLVRAEQTIQDLQTKFHAVRRERAIAIEAARAAQNDQSQAERGRRAAETALMNEKGAAESAQREAREARATVQDLRVKLATATQTIEMLQAQLEQERQARIIVEQAPSMPALPATTSERAAAPSDQPVKRKRGRPPGKRDGSALRKTYSADQEPVQWWTDDWKPHA
jgi:chromosome segregation ATPase